MSLVTRSAEPIIIDIENITKDYVMGEEIVHALRGVSLQIRSNEYLAIMGQRQWQIDAYEHARLPRYAEFWALRVQWA